MLCNIKCTDSQHNNTGSTIENSMIELEFIESGLSIKHGQYFYTDGAHYTLKNKQHQADTHDTKIYIT